MGTILKVSCYRNSCIDFDQILHNDGDHQVVVMGGPNRRQTNPRWRTAAILKNPLNHHISATAWPILMKFGTVTHIGPLQRIVRKKFEFLKIQHGGGRHLKNHKIALSAQRFDRSLRNLVRLCNMGLLTSQTVKKLNFKNPTRLPFWKPLNHHISATFWPILIKFGTVVRVGPWRKVQIFNFWQNENDIPIKDDTVAENWDKN